MTIASISRFEARSFELILEDGSIPDGREIFG